jgi:hypothetical protein
VDTGSILGLSALRPSFLVDISPAEPRQDQACIGAQLMTDRHVVLQSPASLHRVDDDIDDDVDDDDEFSDEDEDPDEEDEEGDDDETETWQVSSTPDSAKGRLRLDFRN